MLRLPDLNAVLTVPLFDRPKRADEETDEAFAEREQRWRARSDVKLRMRLLDKPTYRELTFAFQDVVASERRRLRELRAETPADLMPEVHEPTFRTREGHAAMDALVLRVFDVALVGVLGLKLTGTTERDVSTETEPARLFEALRHFGLHELALMRIFGAQNPEPEALLL